MIKLEQYRWAAVFGALSIGIATALIYAQPTIPKALPSKLIATWDYNTNAGGYWIQWTTNGASFSKYNSVSVERTNSVTLTTIEQGKVYHVRISTTGPRSPWSATQVFYATNTILPTVVVLTLESSTNLINWHDEPVVMTQTNPPGVFKTYRMRITK